MTNKEKATSFLKMAGTGEVKAAYDRFIAPHFTHHNQYFKADRQTLMDAMIEAHGTHPNKSITIKHVYEDGNTVVTCSIVAKETMEIAVVHIFRFEGDKVVELWDLGQPIDKNSPNSQPGF